VPLLDETNLNIGRSARPVGSGCVFACWRPFDGKSTQNAITSRSGRKTRMVSINELTKIESVLRRAENPRACNEYVGKMRMWLATGQAPIDVRRRLEQLVARFGGTRFAGSSRRPS
jgi:hypothetical protein